MPPLPITLYDSYLKKEITIDPDKTVQPGTLKMYSCGPTVYNYQSIGNMRAAWLPDTIAKVAKLAGWQVEWTLNITDVGHLVSDGDEGEDKIEKGAKRDGKTVQEIVDYYTQDYRKQCKALNFDIPTGFHNPKATDYIKEQMLLAILLLVQEGSAYLTDDGIYYDTIGNQKFSTGVKPVQDDKNNNYTGRDIVQTDKRHPDDFALWKFVSEKNLQKWRFEDFEGAREILERLKLPPNPLDRGDGILTQANPETIAKFGRLNYNPDLKDRAKKMSKNLTKTEKVLWDEILSKKQTGFKFVKQQIIYNYILDFYCSELLLGIEVDGEVHQQDFNQAYDKQRDEFLNACGIKILRLKNENVLDELDSVIETIKQEIQQRQLELQTRQNLPLSRGPGGSLQGAKNNLLNRWGTPGWHSECVCMICGTLNGQFPPKLDDSKDRRLKTEELAQNQNLPLSRGPGGSLDESESVSVIDLHTGGEDHIDIHHKNEILQSQALGFNLSQHWVHNKFVMVDGGKMSKSLGNVYLVTGKYEDTGFYSLEHPPEKVRRQLQKKYGVNDFEPLAYRLMLMEHHYTEQLNFTWEKLEQSQNRLWNLRKEAAMIANFSQGGYLSDQAYSLLQESKNCPKEKYWQESQNWENELFPTLFNNLNTPKFLETFQVKISEIYNKINVLTNTGKKEDLLEALAVQYSYAKMFETIDHKFLKLEIGTNFHSLPENIQQTTYSRFESKKAKDYQAADKLRDEIAVLGWQVDDYPWGWGVWVKNSIQANRT